jgi:hypothetical protein
MELVLNYPIRPATVSERKWFTKNPRIAGYAAPDNAVVFNPDLSHKTSVRRSIYINEAVRIFLREHRIVPRVSITKAQLVRFRGTAYEHNMSALRQTLIARIVAGDRSASRITPEQIGYATALSQIVTITSANRL